MCRYASESFQLKNYSLVLPKLQLINHTYAYLSQGLRLINHKYSYLPQDFNVGVTTQTVLHQQVEGELEAAAASKEESKRAASE